MVEVCAYRNLYSWEILSTKRPDCLDGLIATRHPFGGDDKCNMCHSFFYENMKMTQFDKKNVEGRAIVNDVSSVITALIMTK